MGMNSVDSRYWPEPLGKIYVVRRGGKHTDMNLLEFLNKTALVFGKQTISILDTQRSEEVDDDVLLDIPHLTQSFVLKAPKKRK